MRYEYDTKRVLQILCLTLSYSCLGILSWKIFDPHPKYFYSDSQRSLFECFSIFNANVARDKQKIGLPCRTMYESVPLTWLIIWLLLWILLVIGNILNQVLNIWLELVDFSRLYLCPKLTSKIYSILSRSKVKAFILNIEFVFGIG